ncbi:hypothetical protein CR513_10981, partial [Mucuna pruriens]
MVQIQLDPSSTTIAMVDGGGSPLIHQSVLESQAVPSNRLRLHHHLHHLHQIRFSRYNQICMAPKDKEKTTFITTWGTFCYKVMSFGLKNARATYQRAMVTLFHDMMHKEVEVYVDDMIAKSKTPGQHIDYMQKLFERMRKYWLRLNPAKCTFGVGMGKLFGFIVNKIGIELDRNKESIGGIHGGNPWGASWDSKMISGKSKPYITLVLGTRTNMLSIGLGREEVKAIHAGSHHTADY